MPNGTVAPWLVWLFWILAGGDLLGVLYRVRNPGSGEFTGLVFLFWVFLAVCLAGVCLTVAIVGRPAAYVVGLVVMGIPAAGFAWSAADMIVSNVGAPSDEDRTAGRGYFKAPGDRALAEAIVAADASKVATLAPAANLNAQGWHGMTFMRLALTSYQRSGTDVIRTLLRAGLDPDQESGLLFSTIKNDQASSLVDGEPDVQLLRAAVEAGVDLNKKTSLGPWYSYVSFGCPNALTLALDHGADLEIVDDEGRTPIMNAADIGTWEAVEILHAHHARTDRVAKDGATFRDILSRGIETQKGFHREIPPQILALQASLR